MTAPLPASRSLKQAFESFIEQRVEEYKETLSREKLLQIGDEAIRELEHESGTTTQYLFTEVLIADNVNRLIAKRLKLPTYRRWVTRYLALRNAQLDPMHWGLSPQGALARSVRALDEGDPVLVIGTALCGAALYAAAHEVPVMLVDQDLASIEVAENRAVTEQLSLHFEAFVVSLGDWLPPCNPRLVLIDAATLLELDGPRQQGLMEELLTRGDRHATHIVLAGPGERDAKALQAQVAETYEGWERSLLTIAGTDVTEILVARMRGLAIE